MPWLFKPNKKQRANKWNKKHINVMNEEQMQLLGEKVVEVLHNVYDPEIPVDIYELGLIYDVRVSDLGSIEIDMTLTSPSCPVAESMPEEVKQKVSSLDEVKDVEVIMVFEPTWTKDMMSEEAKLELGFL
jgi:FeS assembly SUF system protein